MPTPNPAADYVTLDTVLTVPQFDGTPYEFEDRHTFITPRELVRALWSWRDLNLQIVQVRAWGA